MTVACARTAARSAQDATELLAELRVRRLAEASEHQASLRPLSGGLWIDAAHRVISPGRSS
jgi:hypothetical protein